MKPLAWYNEPDRQKAATLRLLIEAGAIAPGVVDERPIQEITPDDVKGFCQAHFFAGGGVWSYALRLSGWPDDRPVWTGSCPCGPFSAAGKKLGFADPRHLWPAWLPLIRECRPDVLFGEQSDDANAWVDLVSSDLEDLGYAIGSPDIPAAGFAGAHIRQRFYWVADTDNAEWWSERAPWHDGHWPQTGRVQGHGHIGDGGASLRLGDPRSARLEGRAAREVGLECAPPERTGGLEWVGYPDRIPGVEGGSVIRGRYQGSDARAWPGLGGAGDVDWLFCRDSTWRPVEPGACPLADETPARMGRLRLYGDAIDAETAANFIGAYLDSAPARGLAA